MKMSENKTEDIEYNLGFLYNLKKFLGLNYFE
jgi:hypothetical protein